MSQPERIDEHLSTQQHPSQKEAPPEGKSYIGRGVMLAIVAALVAWTAIRIHAAQGEQQKLAEDRNAAAEAAKKERKDKPVTLVHGEAATWTPEVRIEGTLQPVEEADLAFKVTGKLSSIRAKVGDYVHRGQLLATFDSTENAAALEQAKAQLRVAEASAKLADDSASRSSVLIQKGAGSAQSDLQAQENRNQAHAQLDAAKASVSLAQANLSNMTLVAPFSGYVTKVPPGAGQVFTFGTTLFHLQNTAELKLVGTVGEADVGLVSVGLPVKIATPEGEVVGTVTAVLGSVDSATRRVPLEAKVPNDPKHPLLAGTYVRASVVGKQPVNVLKLPSGALRPGSQDEVVVAESGRARIKRIVFHPADNGIVYVRSGLATSDQVVVDPSPEAKDGDTLVLDSTTKATK